MSSICFGLSAGYIFISINPSNNGTKKKSLSLLKLQEITNIPSAQGHWSVCASFWRSFSCPFCRPFSPCGTHLPLPMSTILGSQPVPPCLGTPSSSQFWKQPQITKQYLREITENINVNDCTRKLTARFNSHCFIKRSPSAHCNLRRTLEHACVANVEAVISRLIPQVWLLATTLLNWHRMCYFWCCAGENLKRPFRISRDNAHYQSGLSAYAALDAVIIMWYQSTCT